MGNISILPQTKLISRNLHCSGLKAIFCADLFLNKSIKVKLKVPTIPQYFDLGSLDSLKFFCIFRITFHLGLRGAKPCFPTMIVSFQSFH